MIPNTAPKKIVRELFDRLQIFNRPLLALRFVILASIIYSILSAGREMSLSDFKFIFYMEWGHRLWGRATGTVFLLPAAFFLYKGWISRAMKPRLALYTALIGFQVGSPRDYIHHK